jgi:hypothetical protein
MAVSSEFWTEFIASEFAMHSSETLGSTGAATTTMRGTALRIEQGSTLLNPEVVEILWDRNIIQ